METTPVRLNYKEAGDVTRSEPQIVESLIENVRWVASNYKSEREAGRDGTNINLGPSLEDIEDLDLLGSTKKPNISEAITKFGADPIIRLGMMARIAKSDEDFNHIKVDPQIHSDLKQEAFNNIRRDLYLGQLLGLDQNHNHPSYQPAAELFNNLKNQYRALESPEDFKTEQQKADEFYAQLEQVSHHISDQQNALNLQNIKTLEGFTEVETPIQNLVSDYSRKDFNLQSHHLLSIQEISEKLAEELEEKRGWDKTAHDNNVAAIALALNLEITNRASQISGSTSTAERSSP